ncbi:hypothetical protein [Brucella intermedia]|uniref:hypothetical protein n=1 Tax=Brucella intermedia TaxID=94625 RepID=UPI00178C4FCC|nr:hypothetical protein [Brucella intermedia]
MYGRIFLNAPQNIRGLFGGQPKLSACRISLTQNRFALLLEMLWLAALSYAKPLHTFAGNVLACRICLTQNRFALLLEMLYFSSAQ